ncbi:hypothetical protein MHU86_4167 [Fragilaria crotonensis]|nr:hypothetical protein MHU86_4167 [Fragilaria crotonensis]
MIAPACVGRGTKFCTVEWSAKISGVRSQIEPYTTHFLLPNLPSIITREQENLYFSEIKPEMRICTIAASLHDNKSLRQRVADCSPKVDKYLIVGGNSKGESAGTTSLSTVEAARIIQAETNTEIWGVANPNDRASPTSTAAKIDAGIRGIITQPCFSSHSLEVLESYPRYLGVSYIAGMALPTSTKDLMFWLQLLGQPDVLDDPLSRNHIKFFSSCENASLVWAENELEKLTKATIDGVHYMPMKNIDDLMALISNQQ